MQVSPCRQWKNFSESRQSMSYKIKATFAEGVTLDDMQQMVEKMTGDPNLQPPDTISHTEEMIDGRLVFIDEWESKEVFEAFFSGTAPLMEQHGLPVPTIEEL